MMMFKTNNVVLGLCCVVDERFMYECIEVQVVHRMWKEEEE
jgi:hypothetical protein